MVIKGIEAWADYIAQKYELICEQTPWGNNYCRFHQTAAAQKQD